jgi:hypothetical protein
MEWNGLELGKMIGVLLTSGGGCVASLPSLENSTGLHCFGSLVDLLPDSVSLWLG